MMEEKKKTPAEARGANAKSLEALGLESSCEGGSSVGLNMVG